MPDDADRFEVYYQEKLWNLLPGLYRSQDNDVPGENGPLRELANRIGTGLAHTCSWAASWEAPKVVERGRTRVKPIVSGEEPFSADAGRFHSRNACS